MKFRRRQRKTGLIGFIWTDIGVQKSFAAWIANSLLCYYQESATLWASRRFGAKALYCGCDEAYLLVKDTRDFLL